MLHMQSSHAQVARWCLLTSVPREVTAWRICLWKHIKQGLVQNTAVRGARSKAALTSPIWDAPQTSGHSELKAAFSSLPTWVFHSEKLHWKRKRMLVPEKIMISAHCLSISQPKRNAFRLEKSRKIHHFTQSRSHLINTLHRKKFIWNPPRLQFSSAILLFIILFRDREGKERACCFCCLQPSALGTRVDGGCFQQDSTAPCPLPFWRKGLTGGSGDVWAAALRDTASGPGAQLCTGGEQGTGACLMATSRKSFPKGKQGVQSASLPWLSF